MNSPWGSSLHTGAVFRLSTDQNPFLETTGDLLLWGIKKWRKRAEFGQYKCRRVRSCNEHLLEPIWVFCKNFKWLHKHVSSQDSRKFHPHDNIFTYFYFTKFATCVSLQDTKGKLETYTYKQAHHTDQRSGQISKSIVSGSSFSAVKTISVLKFCHTIMRYKVPCDPSRSGNKLSLRTEAFYICWLHENKIILKNRNTFISNNSF